MCFRMVEDLTYTLLGFAKSYSLKRKHVEGVYKSSTHLLILKISICSTGDSLMVLRVESSVNILIELKSNNQK